MVCWLPRCPRDPQHKMFRKLVHRKPVTQGTTQLSCSRQFKYIDHLRGSVEGRTRASVNKKGFPLAQEVPPPRLEPCSREGGAAERRVLAPLGLPEAAEKGGRLLGS